VFRCDGGATVLDFHQPPIPWAAWRGYGAAHPAVKRRHRPPSFSHKIQDICIKLKVLMELSFFDAYF
jgi:hypothetical protein